MITETQTAPAATPIVPDPSSSVLILPVSYAAILDDPAAPALLQSYAEECLVPDASPQRQLYETMERVGAIQCFGAYLDGNLSGFISVFRTIVPHDGHLIACIESFFVSAPARPTGAALLLLAAAEHHATLSGCRCLLASARLDSALDLLLTRRPGYARTHSQHTLWLNGYKGGRE
jgi:hypothetical protein